MMDENRKLLSAASAAVVNETTNEDAVSVATTSGIGSIDSKDAGSTSSMGHKKRNVEEEEDEEDEGVQDQKVKEVFNPPDGGLRAWLVMLASFLCNGIIFGIINSYGVIFVFLKSEMPDDEDAATKASLVGALAVGATFLVSPVAGVLADRLGIRATAVLGGVLATLGLFTSSFCVQRIDALCFTYGVLFGGGSSLCYTPSLAILGHYFRKRIGIVNGIVTAGSSLFTMVMPFALHALLSSLGLSTTLLVLSGMTSILILATLSFKPLIPVAVTDRNGGDGGCCSQIIKVDNWKNRKYLIWSLAIPSALFGYFVPYVHIVQFVKDILPDSNGNSLVTCIGITSGLGRILFGYISDLPRTNRVFLQQISFVSIGLCTMLLPAAPYFPESFQFQSLIIIALVMGLFDGCFITMLGPIAFDLCGPAGASQAIGFLLGMCSIPLTVGPPIAGWLYDSLGNYTVAFLAAGCPPIIGALLMCFVYVVKGPADSTSASSEDCESTAVVASGATEEGRNLLTSHQQPGATAAGSETVFNVVAS